MDHQLSLSLFCFFNQLVRSVSTSLYRTVSLCRTPVPPTPRCSMRPSRPSPLGLHGKPIFPISSVQRDASLNWTCFFTQMTPFCLWAFRLLSFDETPILLASYPDSYFHEPPPLAKYPSTLNPLFWPRHHHRLPCDPAFSRTDPVNYSGPQLPASTHACTYLLRALCMPIVQL